jgi:AcrR family transcriptional regulator
MTADDAQISPAGSADAAEPVAEPRHPGRPRSATAEDAILRATIELIAQGGLDAATIQAVGDRSGVARATIYLRWPSRDALIQAALRKAIGRDPYPLTGDIEEDLRGGARQALGILSEPAFAKVLPSLIAALLKPDKGPDDLTFDLLFPNRRRVADEYRLSAADQGWRADIEAEVAVDLVLGTLLFELLATASPPTAARAEQVLDVVIAGLRRTDSAADPAPPAETGTRRRRAAGPAGRRAGSPPGRS